MLSPVQATRSRKLKHRSLPLALPSNASNGDPHVPPAKAAGAAPAHGAWPSPIASPLRRACDAPPSAVAPWGLSSLEPASPAVPAPASVSWDLSSAVAEAARDPHSFAKWQEGVAAHAVRDYDRECGQALRQEERDEDPYFVAALAHPTMQRLQVFEGGSRAWLSGQRSLVRIPVAGLSRNAAIVGARDPVIP